MERSRQNGQAMSHEPLALWGPKGKRRPTRRKAWPWAVADQEGPVARGAGDVAYDVEEAETIHVDLLVDVRRRGSLRQ